MAGRGVDTADVRRATHRRRLALRRRPAGRARVESAGARRGARRPGSSVQVCEWNLQVRDVALDDQGHQYTCASGICRCATWRSTTRVISTGVRVESAGARRCAGRPGPVPVHCQHAAGPLKGRHASCQRSEHTWSIATSFTAKTRLSDNACSTRSGHRSTRLLALPA